MTDFAEAMMIRCAAQGDETARRWLAELFDRTDGRDGLPLGTWRHETTAWWEKNSPERSK